MKGIFIFLVGLFMFSCNVIKIAHFDNDASLIFQNDDQGQIWLSTLNSAQQINIIELKYKGDTLVINYERGAFVSPNNIIPLNEKTKYLKCANKLYRVELSGEQYKITETKQNEL